MTVTAPRFTHADAVRAHDEWGCNCGPGALAAIAGLTLDQVRALFPDFAAKGYVNPTMMLCALESSGLRFRSRALASNVATLDFPRYGLCRVQWEGPWTKPGVPIRARYRHTHWIGAAKSGGEVGVFDINCINNGVGWVALPVWEAVLVPYILKECVPRANGKWHLTHAIEVARSP